MKRRTRVLSAILILMMNLALLSACGQNNVPSSEQMPPSEGQQQTEGKEQASDVPEYLNPTGLPIVKEKIALRIMAGRHPLQADWNEMLVWEEAEKRTGIHIDWDMVPQTNIQERKNIALASNDLPDAFMSAGINTVDLMTYGSQGTFIKLNDLIDEYAPNLKAALQRMPDAAKGIVAPDGSIYSMPWLCDMLSATIDNKLFINKKWLDAVGMRMPSTTDEFYEVLKAFKTGDPNGNGEQDEIPFTARQGIEGVIKTFKGAWGLGTRGSQHPNVDVNESTGKLRFIPTDPKYREVLQYIHKLYAEGLLDQEIYTINNDQSLTAKGDQDLVGSFAWVNTILIGNTHEQEFIGLSAALKGPHDDQMWSDMLSSVKDVCSYTITKSNKYPEASIRWGDYFYSDEGLLLFFMGIEGKTYHINEKGEYRYTDEIIHNPKGLTQDEATGQYMAWFRGGPAIKTEKYSLDSGAGLPVVMEASENLKPYLPKEIWPPFMYTVEENDRMVALSNDINKYVSEMQSQFISGRASFNQWDNYVNTIKKMGLDEYMKIYQAAYDRYKKN